MLLRHNPGYVSLIFTVVHEVLAFFVSAIDTARVKSRCLMLPLNQRSLVLSCFIFPFTLFHSDTYLITSRAVHLPITLNKYAPAFRFHTGDQIVPHTHRVFDSTHEAGFPKGQELSI